MLEIITKQNVYKDWMQGMSRPQIVKKYDKEVSRSTIYTWIKSFEDGGNCNGPDRDLNRRSFDPEVRKMVDDYEQTIEDQQQQIARLSEQNQILLEQNSKLIDTIARLANS